jgi:hypothetical protein
MKSRKPKMSDLRKVGIDIGGSRVAAWEAKDPNLRNLGRWSDAKALLQRIYEFKHPEEAIPEGPGRQWQATWRGRFSLGGRGRTQPAPSRA